MVASVASVSRVANSSRTCSSHRSLRSCCAGVREGPVWTLSVISRASLDDVLLETLDKRGHLALFGLRGLSKGFSSRRSSSSPLCSDIHDASKVPGHQRRPLDPVELIERCHRSLCREHLKRKALVQPVHTQQTLEALQELARHALLDLPIPVQKLP